MAGAGAKASSSCHSLDKPGSSVGFAPSQNWRTDGIRPREADSRIIQLLSALLMSDNVAGFFKIRCDRSGAGGSIRIWLFSDAVASVVQSRHRSTFVSPPEAGRP